MTVLLGGLVILHRHIIQQTRLRTQAQTHNILKCEDLHLICTCFLRRSRALLLFLMYIQREQNAGLLNGNCRWGLSLPQSTRSSHSVCVCEWAPAAVCDGLRLDLHIDSWRVCFAESRLAPRMEVPLLCEWVCVMEMESVSQSLHCAVSVFVNKQFTFSATLGRCAWSRLMAGPPLSLIIHAERGVPSCVYVQFLSGVPRRLKRY